MSFEKRSNFRLQATLNISLLIRYIEAQEMFCNFGSQSHDRSYLLSNKGLATAKYSCLGELADMFSG
jgi:hypothetical protein